MRIMEKRGVNHEEIVGSVGFQEQSRKTGNTYVNVEQIFIQSVSYAYGVLNWRDTRPKHRAYGQNVTPAGIY